YPPGAHLKTEPYGWCWAAALFFDHDPKYQKIFRESPQFVADVTKEFSTRLINRLPEAYPLIAEQWQWFVFNVEYGYDVARESIVRKAMPVALPNDGATIAVVADRGWQSSGFELEAGKTYSLSAQGQF